MGDETAKRLRARPLLHRPLGGLGADQLPGRERRTKMLAVTAWAMCSAMHW
jgi:hypothetical protein